MNEQITVIVSRHPATMAMLKERFPDAAVLPAATEADVRGKHVVGNLPMYLAALCASYTAVEFPQQRGERGVEIENVDGAALTRYIVRPDGMEER